MWRVTAGRYRSALWNHQGDGRYLIHRVLPLQFEWFPQIIDCMDARVDELAPGEMMLVRILRQRIALYNVDGEFFATDDTCSHEEASLSEGFLFDEIVECPLHDAAFCVRTGEVGTFPAVVGIDTYEVRIVDEEVGPGSWFWFPGGGLRTKMISSGRLRAPSNDSIASPGT